MPSKAVCPGCLERVSTDDLQRQGILHARSTAKGGPYYVFNCSNCDQRLVAQRGLAGELVVRSEAQLADQPGVLRILRGFLPAPKRKGASRAKPAMDGAKKRPRRSTIPRATTRSAGDGATPRWSPRELELLSVLRVPVTANSAEIKRFYRTFVRENHPDRRRADDDVEKQEHEAWFITTREQFRELLRGIEARSG